MKHGILRLVLLLNRLSQIDWKILKIFTDDQQEITYESYTISDYLVGYSITRRGIPVFDTLDNAYQKFQLQFLILKSGEKRFESSLFDIRLLVQADLIDSELDAANELCSKGFLRAAGTVAGVALEKHLKQACENHKISIRKKNPTISDFNDKLKENEILDIPGWRFIQRLGDLRNLCSHKKDREPTKEEVNELIAGVDKITKTVY